jgi:uncharacterized protein (TIGR02246 family)
MTSTTTDVRALLDRWSAAIRSRDIDQLMTLYDADIVYFDVVPPLRFTGCAEVRSNFRRWFDSWKSDIGVELRDLNIRVSGDVASANMLHRTSGTRQDGQAVDYWVRATVVCTRTDRGWLIAHEHISWPFDPKTGRVMMDLVP